MANALSTFKFHDGTVDTGNGLEMNVQNYSNILEVEMKTVGTATVVFEAKGLLGVWRPLLGTKMVSPMVILTQTDDMTTFYQFDVTGLNNVRMKVIATSGDPL